jgi:hypothetical protein
MATFLDGKELTRAEFIAFMRSEEAAGNREYQGKPLVRVGDVLMTQETAAEIA